MKKPLHVIYIPGLGDNNPKSQETVVSTWRLYGVKPELFHMKWSDNQAWETKFNRLLARIDELAAHGHRVGLVGASAGAAAAIDAFAARKNVVSGVVLIAGKVNDPEAIGQKVRDHNTSFIPAAYAAPAALKSLQPKELHRILSIYSMKDGLLTREDSHIPGAHNRLTVIMGHPIVIAVQIILGAAGFIRFLKRQKLT